MDIQTLIDDFFGKSINKSAKLYFPLSKILVIKCQSRSGPKACVKWLLLDFYIKKKSWGGLLSKFGSKSSQISWGSQKNQIWSDRSGKRWRDNDRREKVPFQALIIKEIWEKCPKMRFLLFLTRFIKLYEKLTYFIL